MALFKYCLLFILLKQTKCEDCLLDRRSLNVAYDTKLKKDILCNYNPVLPPKENDTNVIYIFFIVRSFKFDDYEEILTMYLWADVEYKDKRLKWNPSEYDGITLARISTDKMWSPGLKHEYNFNEYGIPYYPTSCDVKYDGNVNCVPKLTLETGCSTKLKDWPYDTQTCTIQLGEYYKKNKVVYTSNGTRGLWFIGSEYGAGWNIIDYKTKEYPNSEILITLTFVFERVAVGLAAMIVVPSIIVLLLTITTLLLEVKGGVRLFLACFNLLNHYSLLYNISEEIPKHSFDTPSILLFVRGSFIVTTIVLMLTIILSFLVKREVPAPAWIVTLNVFVLKSKFKHVIWPRWGSQDNVVMISEDLNGYRAFVEWMDFANIINSVCLMLFFWVYIILFCVYMPKPVTTGNTINFVN